MDVLRLKSICFLLYLMDFIFPFDHYSGWRTEDHLCVFELNFSPQGVISKPTLLNSKRMPGWFAFSAIFCMY